MKKVLFILFILIIVFCGCKNTNYKEQIFSLVEENNKILNQYIMENDFIGNITEEIANLNIKEIEVVDDNRIIVFEVYYTGLFDGGVEYGFYYTEGDNELYKQFSTNDYMLIEEISDNWYYYEWHNG